MKDVMDYPIKEVIENPVIFGRYSNDAQGLIVRFQLPETNSVTIEKGAFFTIITFYRMYDFYTGYTNIKHMDPNFINKKTIRFVEPISIAKQSIKFFLELYKIAELKESPNLKKFLEKSLANSKYILNTPEQVAQRNFLGYRQYEYKRLFKKNYPKQPLSIYWSYHRHYIDTNFPYFNDRFKRELENIINIECLTLRQYSDMTSKYKFWDILKFLKLRVVYDTDKGKVIFGSFNKFSQLRVFVEFITEVVDLFLYIKDGNELKNVYINDKGYSMALINLFIERETNSFTNEISILDLCTNLGFIIPHYCYHYNLSIAGNCRMCLVELNANKKPIASCAIDSSVGMNIQTKSKLVERAREGIFEFLLVNHPLDCPVCDQGGECDLQDESLTYGNDRGRFYNIKDLKRSLTDFFISPVIKVILSRCIYCTRCVRFLGEVDGKKQLGLLGRGNLSEIGVYTERNIITELGSTITDFCPVGALTIKTYAYKYRAWEELYIESIDLNDSLCSSIRIYSDYKTITRVLPQYDVELGISWINDKTRHIIDNLRYKQLGYPLFRDSKLLIKKSDSIYFRKNKYRKTSWKNLSILLNIALRYINNEKIYGVYRIKSFLGDDLDILTLLQLKELSFIAGSNYIYNFTENLLFTRSELVNEDFDSNYIFRVKNLREFKNIFLINVNLRRENPILNAKLRQKVLWQRNIRLFFLGSKVNLTYKYKNIGNSIKIFLGMVEGRHHYFNFLIKDMRDNKVNPNLIIYSSELKKHYKNTAYRFFFKYLKGINDFFEIIYLSKGASSLGAMDLSIDRSITGAVSNIYNNNVVFGNEIDANFIDNSINYYVGCTGNNHLLDAQNFLNMYDTKISIHQSHTKDDFFNFVDFFLPSYSHYESEKLFYINCFGILKTTKKNFFGLTESVRDHKELSFFVHTRLTYNNFGRSLLARVENFAFDYIKSKSDYNHNINLKEIIKSIPTKNNDIPKLSGTLLVYFFWNSSSSLKNGIKRGKNYKEFLKGSYKLFGRAKNKQLYYYHNLVFYMFKYIYDKLYKDEKDTLVRAVNTVDCVRDFCKKNVNKYFSREVVRGITNNDNNKIKFLEKFIVHNNLEMCVEYVRKDLNINVSSSIVVFFKEFLIDKVRKNNRFSINLRGAWAVRRVFGSDNSYYYDWMAENSSLVYAFLRSRKRYCNNRDVGFIDLENSFDFMLFFTQISNNPEYNVVYYKILLELNPVHSVFFKSLNQKFYQRRKKNLTDGSFVVNNPKRYLYNYCALLYPYLNISFLNPLTNLLSELNINNLFLLCMIHKDMFSVICSQDRLKYNRGDEFDFDEYESYYYRNNLFYNNENYIPVYADRLFREIYYNLYKGKFKVNYSVENLFVKDSFLQNNFLSIYEKKKNFMVLLNSIRTYLPVHLYNIKRNEFFNIVEEANNYTFVYYYLLSEKERNFFKTNILSYYSKNMSLMSTLNFKNKANFNL